MFYQSRQIFKKGNEPLQKGQQTTYRPTPQANTTHPAMLIQRAKLNPNSLNADEVLTLQEMIGNRAASRLLASRSTTQVQAKLTIGEPGDKYEQELIAHELTHVMQQDQGGAVPQNIQLAQQNEQVRDLDKPTSNHRETGLIQRLAAIPTAQNASDQAVQNVETSVGGSQLLSGWNTNLNAYTAGRSGHNFTVAERQALNAKGDQYGCCICGTKDPGTVSQPNRPIVKGKQVGNFIPDHEPPDSLVGGGYTGTIRFYPRANAS
ncbi:eCIS core domain-containing protein [Calothrix sp. NIES-2098]|uniref:eCIS core domain-containing protein n=1 Tax=Calothrix sp. NIES-2098 TaxID=1954171 RepID=UPI000B5E9C8C|nr:hypothetical protein NIES2098_73480 [Calothrix sp. NIES-2098]